MLLFVKIKALKENTMSQKSFKKNKFYLYIAVGSLLSIPLFAENTEDAIIQTPNEITAFQENAAAEKNEALKKNLESVSEVLIIARKVITKVNLVLDGDSQAFKDIAEISIEPITKTYRSAGNKEIDEFVKAAVTTLKKVIDFFKNYQNKNDAVDFIQKGEKVLTIDTVIALMNRYRNILIESARTTSNTELEQEVNAICAFILAKKAEFDKKTQNPIFVINNISRAMGTKQPSRGHKR